MLHNFFHNRFFQYLKRHPQLAIIARSILITMFLEILARKSLIGGFRFLVRSPLTFVCNAAIICMSLYLSMLAGRWTYFVLDLVTMAWITFGVVNAIVLRYRMTPFSAEDFAMLPSLIRIADNYLTPGMMIAVGAALVLALIALVYLWKKSPRTKVNVRRYLMTLPKMAFCGLSVYLILNMGMYTSAVSADFMNLADAYEQYGFAYCFSTSVIDVGISKPEDYSEETMEQISRKLQPALNTGAEEKSVTPNIIMIQLESFFDPTYLKGFSYSEDPIPCFHELEEQFPSGFFTVPVVGAGTSNTEFEILTGMSTDYFGAGEYPYNTILKERTVEALPHLLRSSGYHSFVIHNNTGTFYNRDTVFAQMGFDTFIPEEYMYNLERTPNNWAKDKVLPGIIEECLTSTRTPDFVYTITVQSHGRYPETQILSEEESVIKVDGMGGNAPLDSVSYYVNEIREVDEMVRDLTDALAGFEEPTMVVLYGDHLPALGFGKDDITQPSLYMTEYVLWNNFGWQQEDKEIQAESIGSELLESFGLTTGIIPAFHAVYDDADPEEYSRVLKLLEYDMLYGEGYIFRQMKGLSGVVIPSEEAAMPAGYEASDLEIGYRPIKVTGAEEKDGVLYVYGSNFNEFTRIIIDEKPMSTIYQDSGTLILDESVPETYETIGTGQFDENLKQLGAAAICGGSF